MSLKTFHIVFIALSVIMAFGFGAWLINGYFSSHDMIQLFGGALSIIAGGALIVYGIRFLRKLRHVSFL